MNATAFSAPPVFIIVILTTTVSMAHCLLGLQLPVLAVRSSSRSVRPSFHSSLRACKNRKRRLDDGSSQDLSWERFEFSGLPKQDRRFLADPSDLLTVNKNNNNDDEPNLSNEEHLRQLQQREAAEDASHREKQRQRLAAWERLDPDTVRRATEAILPYVNEKRVERIRSVLAQRTRQTRFLFENPSNPSNVWACLRTIESFGVQHVDVIIQFDQYQGKAAINQKRGMRTAVGSAQWLTLRNHASTAEAVRTLKQQNSNCRILASDLNANSKDIRNIDWDADEGDDDDRPICIVMGNEERGISQEMREMADETFTLPMVGFAESFNLSVATAITLAHLSAASSGGRDDDYGNGKGPLRPGDLPDRERDCLLLKGLLNSLPQKRMADALLRTADVELPMDLVALL